MTPSSTLINALTTRDAQTENGMPAHSTTGANCLDLFFHLGAARALTDDQVIRLFNGAWVENKSLALKNLFYNRDVREGQGERTTFRVILRWLAETHPEEIRHLVPLVPFYGRWDDLLVLFGTPVENSALKVCEQGLSQNNALCAKWMPRHGVNAQKLRSHLMLTPRSYRKLLSAQTKVVETQMCSGAWGAVNYNHVPSKAATLYRKAFTRHDQARYTQYQLDLTKGVDKDGNVVKVNAGAIFPHDILRPYSKFTTNGKDDLLVEAQWKAQPNWLAPQAATTARRFMPVCDVSGSMLGLPMEVCIALGLYLSERNLGPFQGCFITFSESPKLQRLIGPTLRSRYDELQRADWGGNTDLEKVFGLILSKATASKVPEGEMPTDILVLSDMQFDQACEHPGATAMEMIKLKYAAAGYQVPNVVFWNLRAATSNVPVKVNDQGVACVSGFSPSIMKNLLCGEMSPAGVMLKTLNSPRYAQVQPAVSANSMPTLVS